MKGLFYGIIFVCVLSAAVSEICPIASFAVVCAFLVIGAIFEWRKIHIKWLNRILGVVCFFGLMAIHAFHVDSLNGFVLGTFLNILWTVFCYRAISHEKTSERVQVGVLAMIPLACVAFALEALELILFLTVYFIFLLVYFASLSMSEPTTGCVAVVQHRAITSRLPEKHFWLSLLGTIFLAFLAASVLFLTIPRYGAEAKSSVPGVEQGKGTFPDVELDKTGEINLDPSLLFRAQVPGGQDTYYWRVDIQNRFDGVKWQSRISSRIPPETAHRSDRIQTNPPYEFSFVKEWRDFRIPTLEGTELIVAQNDENNENFKFVHERFGTWKRFRWRQETPLLKLNYWLNGKADSYALDVPDPVVDFYRNSLHLDISKYIASGFHPKYMWPFRRSEIPLEKQLFTLLDTILDGSENDRETADKIQAYLKKNYQYSLKRPVRNGPVVMDFLFDQKFGHCEVFSTTMAVLLALKGIPVRNVTGFVSGEMKDGMNMVRAAHAHSWVEAWIDNQWVRYDPTPTGAQTVELTLLRRIDDWFSTYQASDLYNWVLKYWQFILIFLLMSAATSVTVIAVRRKIIFLLAPTTAVYETAWAKIVESCETRPSMRKYAALSLGDWWEHDYPEMAEMQSFARDYIRFRYAQNEDCPQNTFAKLRRHAQILRQSRLVVRACKSNSLDSSGQKS